MRHSLTILFGVLASTSLACSSSDNSKKRDQPITALPMTAVTTARTSRRRARPSPGPRTIRGQWVPVDGAMCRDGSPAGLRREHARVVRQGDDLLPGGRGRLLQRAHLPTSAQSRQNFDSTTLATAASGAGALDRSNAANPVKDWNYVFVPFCTGDIFAGGHGGCNVTVLGVTGTLQQFVGYKESSICSSIASCRLSRRIRRRFCRRGSAPAASAPESPPISSPGSFRRGTNITLDRAILDRPWADPRHSRRACSTRGGTLWGFDNSFLKDCGADCPDPDNYALDWSFHLPEGQFPKQKGGLIETHG